ncbi:hypothetical protein Tco_0196441 [Tanacetum coccineum]
MANSVISVSSDSLEESVGTPAGRVILFGTIPTTIPDTTPTVTPPATHIDTTLIPVEIPTVSPIIPSSPDYKPTSPDYSPVFDTEFDPSEDPSSDHSSPATSDALRRRVMILAPGQPIPHGRLYRYHPNRPVHMMTARKRVGPLPTHRLAARHSTDYSSSDPFTSDDSLETSSDDLSNSSSSHSYSDNSSPALPSSTRSSHQLCLLVPSIPHSSAATTKRPSHPSFAGPSLKMSRSPTISIPRSSPIPGVFSESSVPRETSLRDDVLFRGSDEPHSEHDIDLEIQIEINECITYADALRAEGIDDRVVVKAVAREEVEMSMRGPVEVRVERVTYPAVSDDIPEPAQKEGAVEVTYETLEDLLQRFHDHTVEILVHQV